MSFQPGAGPEVSAGLPDASGGGLTGSGLTAGSGLPGDLINCSNGGSVGGGGGGGGVVGGGGVGGGGVGGGNAGGLINGVASGIPFLTHGSTITSSAAGFSNQPAPPSAERPGGGGGGGGGGNSIFQIGTILRGNSKQKGEAITNDSG